MSPESAARILEDFVAGKGGPYDFDSFLSVAHDHPAVESARQKCVQVMNTEYPTSDAGGRMSAAGLGEIRSILRELKASVK
jgi:hypothetical protein